LVKFLPCSTVKPIAIAEPKQRSAQKG
jgi:hypothetical protein